MLFRLAAGVRANRESSESYGLDGGVEHSGGHREDREQPADDGADVREEVVERDRLLRDDDRHR